VVEHIVQIVLYIVLLISIIYLSFSLRTFMTVFVNSKVIFSKSLSFILKRGEGLMCVISLLNTGYCLCN